MNNWERQRKPEDDFLLDRCEGCHCGCRGSATEDWVRLACGLRGETNHGPWLHYRGVRHTDEFTRAVASEQNVALLKGRYTQSTLPTADLVKQ
jgi:hypothetical protein